MTVEYGNVFYFAFPLAALGMFFGFYFLLKEKSERFRKWFVFGLLAFNLALHFGKLLFRPYSDKLPILLRKITPENICAFSTLVFPFIYLTHNDTLRDYMFYVGTLSGIAASFIPTEALGFSPFTFDVVRFYLCHSILWIAPLLMVLFGLHKLDYRRVWRVPCVFICVLGIIVANEVILFRVGLLSDKFATIEDMFNPAIRNSSFIFGPTPNLEKPAIILTALCPKFLRTNIITGEPAYCPIFWMVIPVFVYMIPLFFGVSMIWDRARFVADMKSLAAKIRVRREERRAADGSENARESGAECGGEEEAAASLSEENADEPAAVRDENGRPE